MYNNSSYIQEENELLMMKNLFYSNHGYLQIKELRSNGFKLTDVRRYQDQGVIKRVDQGLYRWIGESVDSYLVDVCAQIPSGVFCLNTSLFYHNLIQKQPSICYIAVLQQSIGHNVPTYPKTQLIYMPKKAVNLGVKEVVIGDKVVRVFDEEKSLCDCLKYRNKIGTEIIEDAFRSYKSKQRVNEKLIWRYGEEMRMKLILQRYLPKLLY